MALAINGELRVQAQADKIAETNNEIAEPIGEPDGRETFPLSSILQFLQKLTLVPRLRRRSEAAAYCGITPQIFDDWVQKGRLPGPIPGTRRWDVRAIDLALDRLSGIGSSSTAHSAFDQWKAGRND